MESKKVPKLFRESLKTFRKGLDVVWVGVMQRFAIVHIHEYTKQFRVIRIVETPDGEFRYPDVRDINYIKLNVNWELMDKYPDFRDLGEQLLKERRDRTAKKKKARQEFIKDFIRDNKWIKQAVRDFWETGKTGPAQKPRESKIIIDVNKNAHGSTKAYASTRSGILIPKFGN